MTNKILSRMIKGGAIASILLPIAVMAAAAVPTNITPVGASSNFDIVTLLVNVIGYILGFAAAIAVLFLIIGGIKYIVSQGNADSIEGAKHTILYAVVGLVVIATSFVIVGFAKNRLVTQAVSCDSGKGVNANGECIQ